MKLENITLENPVQWVESKRNDLFFEPKIEKLEFKGKLTKWDMIYREQEGLIHPIKPMTGRYFPVKNSEIDEVIRGNSHLPLELNLKLSANRNDSKFQMVYDIKEKELVPDGEISPRMIVKNSYDGTGLLKFQLGFFRFVCSNMHSVEMPGMVLMMKEKHCPGNFTDELKEKVNPWMQSVLSSECFTSIREKIQEMKQKKEMILKDDLMNQFTAKNLLMMVAIIQKYAQSMNLISSSDGPFRFQRNLQRKIEAISYLKEKLHGERFNDERIEDKFDEIQSSLTYDEGAVTNQWMLYCLMIKLAQNFVKQHQRIDVAREIGKHFWN